MLSCDVSLQACRTLLHGLSGVPALWQMLIQSPVAEAQAQTHLQHVREEEEQARVHARAQAYRRQDAEADPPDHELGPVLRFAQRTLSGPCRRKHWGSCAAQRSHCYVCQRGCDMQDGIQCASPPMASAHCLATVEQHERRCPESLQTTLPML